MGHYQTVIITGSNRGLGLEFVRQLAPKAKHVFAACRTPENAPELNALAGELGNVELVPLDVCSERQIKSLSARLKGAPVDLLINNAGVGDWTGYPLDVESWDRALRVNAIAPIKVSEALAENVAASDRKMIANITSKMGSIADNGSGGSVIYRSSKAALNAAARSFAIDHAEQGVTTLLLHPGWVRTDMGGSNGLIDAPESVAGMCQVIDTADSSANGHFFDYAGSEVAW